MIGGQVLEDIFLADPHHERGDQGLELVEVLGALDDPDQGGEPPKYLWVTLQNRSSYSARFILMPFGQQIDSRV